MKVPLESSASHTSAVETELPGVVTVVDLGTNQGRALHIDMIIIECSGGSTPLGPSSEIPVERLKSRLAILFDNCTLEASSNFTIGRSPSSSEIALVTGSFEKLAVASGTKEPSISRENEFQSLLSVLVDSVMLFKLDSLRTVLIRVAELHRLMLRGTIGLHSTVVTAVMQLVARKVRVELLKNNKEKWCEHHFLFMHPCHSDMYMLTPFLSTYLEDIPLRLAVSAPVASTRADHLNLMLRGSTEQVDIQLSLMLHSNNVLSLFSSRVGNLDGGRGVLCE